MGEHSHSPGLMATSSDHEAKEKQPYGSPSPTPSHEPRRTLAAPDQYQCQQRSCLQWQPAAPQCRFCHATLTGPLSGKRLAWLDQTLLIRERLGGGGMGEVYCGFLAPLSPENNIPSEALEEVAIKFNKELGQPERTERFKREVDHLSKITSPHCVKVLGYGEQLDDGVLKLQYMVMERLHGTVLSELLAKGPLSPKEVLSLFRQLAEALAQLHRQDVIHRDLKPDNIMLVNRPDQPYQAKLFDFGLAKDVSLSAEQTSGSGIVMGTPWYMSPEQAKGEDIDQQSDLFSLGIILYELLTGERPYPAHNLFELFQLHMKPPPLIPMQLPHPLPALLRGALAYDRTQRFQTVDECIALLDEMPTGYDYFVPIQPTPSHSGSFSTPQPALADAEPLPPPLPAWLLWLLLLFVVSSGGIAYFFFTRANRQVNSSHTHNQRPAPANGKINTKKNAPRPTPGKTLASSKTPHRRPPPLASLKPPQRGSTNVALTRRPVPYKPRRTKWKRRRSRIKPAPQLKLLLTPACERLLLLSNDGPARRLEAPSLKQKPGRYWLRCISNKIRLKRDFSVDIKPKPALQTHRQRWRPIKVKFLFPNWAYPYVDGFLIKRCTIGCITTLWSGTSQLVLKRRISGSERRAPVLTTTLQLPPSLHNAPLSKRTFKIRWD